MAEEAAASMATTIMGGASTGMAITTTTKALSWVISAMTMGEDMETGMASVPATTSALFFAKP